MTLSVCYSSKNEKKGEEMRLKFILLTKEIKLSPQTDNLPLLYKADKIF